MTQSLYIFNLDNTLYFGNVYPRINKEYIKIINKVFLQLKNSGAKIAIASHYSCLELKLNEMGVFDLFDIIINKHGVSIEKIINDYAFEKIIYFDDQSGFNINVDTILVDKFGIALLEYFLEPDSLELNKYKHTIKHYDCISREIEIELLCGWL